MGFAKPGFSPEVENYAEKQNDKERKIYGNADPEGFLQVAEFWAMIADSHKSRAEIWGGLLLTCPCVKPGLNVKDRSLEILLMQVKICQV